MNEYEVPQEGPVNYYKGAIDSVSGLRYRLDGDDFIEQAVDTLRGGVKSKVAGKKQYYDEFRCMNDLGIQRAKMVIQSGVNKVSHLTKYKDEERLFRQIRSIIKAWVFEVTLNMKSWAPEADFVDGKLINPHYAKVRNKRLVIQTIENAVLQGMQRGVDAMEAQLTAKSWGVTEIMDNREQQRKQGVLSGFFGRRGGGGGMDYG